MAIGTKLLRGLRGIDGEARANRAGGLVRRRLRSVAVATAVAWGTATSTHAEFTGYSLTADTVGNLTKYTLFGNFNGATDTVLNTFHISLVSGSTSFYHADALNGGVSSNVAGTWNPQFVLVPGAMDSYVCIGGGEGFASGNSTALDPDWGAAGHPVQIPYGNGDTNGPGWFNQNPSNLQGRVNAKGQVKLGQFVVANDAPAATIRLKNGYNNGQGGGVQFGDSTFTIGCVLDCNENGQCDYLDIAAGAPDCNANFILDECELANGTATDCDANGVLDACDIASGAADCNANGFPDSCELANGTATDCDANGALDACDIAAGAPDCDADGLPDRCEGATPVDLTHAFAFSSAAPYEYTFTGLPRAYTGTPRLVITATADLGSATDALVVALDGATGTTIFLGDGSDCPSTPDEATITRDLPAFNALVADGALRVRVTAIGAVNTANCPDGGIAIRLVYEGLPAAGDCNANGLLDSCEIDTGALADCDGDRILDVCELASGAEGDCNGNGSPDACDLASGASTDLDANGVLDECAGEYIVGGSGFATVQAAIDAAPNGATVRVGAGTYGPIVLAGRSLELVSLAGAEATVLDGQGARVVDIVGQGGGALVLDGFTITGGNLSGAGLRITDAGPSIRNCRLTGNTAPNGRGAGAQCIRSTARFTNCTFDANTGLQGAGLSVEGFLASGHLVQVIDCVFRGNTAQSYGGAINAMGPLVLSGSIVEENAANAQPPQPLSGALHIFTADPVTITDTKFCRNTLTNIVGSFVNGGGVILSQDCDGDGLCDYDEVVDGGEPDCNANLVPDACEITGGSVEDCNGNGVPDGCDIASEASADVDGDGTPDECQPDCDGDGLPDSYEIAEGAADCNANGIPDACDLASGASTDLDANGVLDECAGEYIVGGSGYTSVQAAIDAAPNGASVLVSAGSYGRLDLTGRALAVRAIAGPASTFIDGGGTERCFSMQGEGPGETVIEGFTFRNGFADCGGAVRVTLSSPRFLGCVFTGNVGTVHGGAVALHGTAAEFIGCDFVGNGAGLGGAVWIEGEPSTGVALFEGCAFEGNEAGSIGGAILNSGQLELRDCVIERNLSLIAGGGASFLSQGAAWVGGTRFCMNSLGNVQGQFTDLGGNILSQDCDGDGVCDFDEIAAGDEPDCDANGLPDACDLAAGVADCNENGVPDGCDIGSGASNDIDSNGVPDECKPDCDGDGVPDAWELANGLDADCDGDGAIDSCQIAAGAEDDDADGRLDRCEYARGDLNLDGIVNGADLSTLLSLWGLVNPPVGDLDGDGTIGAADLAFVLGNWGPLP